ncbi:MAG: glycosyltransferase family A protein [Gemmatimonadaceae bacterium]
MNGPTVSCILPAYNAARFIGEAIDSVLTQSIAVSDLIVVDDGSTDGTPDVVSRYGAPVRLLVQSNAGPASARNNGVRNSDSDFIAFLDADDLWTRDKIAIQLRQFEAKPALQVCFGDLFNFRTNDPNGAFRDGYTEVAEWPRVPFSPCTLLARRSAFTTIGDFDETLRRGEDTEWFVRMMMRKVPYEVLKDVLLWRRVHDQNLTLENPPGPQDVIRVLKIALDRRRAEGW